MNWMDIVHRTEGLRQIFGTAESRLVNIEIVGLVFERDGPVITMIINLSEYPATPPEKWVKRECNQIQIRLQLVNVTAVNMNGWGIENRGEISIEKKDDLQFEVSTATLKSSLLVRCEAIWLQDFSAYKNEQRLAK